MRAPSFCVECDAPRGECFHDGPLYLEPIAYHRVAGDTPGTWQWAIPADERDRIDNPPRTWATITRPPEVDDPDQHPFRCASCGGTLTRMARLRGYARCYTCARKDGA